MILTQHDDEAGLWKFFAYYEEYENRQKKVVARMHNVDAGFSVGSGKHLRKVGPDEVELVVFTDDPGFFLCSPNHQCEFRFFPKLSWTPLPDDAWEIVDEEEFARILSTDDG